MSNFLAVNTLDSGSIYWDEI